MSAEGARAGNKILTLCLETYGQSCCRTKRGVTLNLAVMYRERERESQVQTECFGLSASQFLFVKLTSGGRQMLIFAGNFTESFKPFDNGSLVFFSLICCSANNERQLIIYMSNHNKSYLNILLYNWK